VLGQFFFDNLNESEINKNQVEVINK